MKVIRTPPLLSSLALTCQNAPIALDNLVAGMVHLFLTDQPVKLSFICLALITAHPSLQQAATRFVVSEAREVGQANCIFDMPVRSQPLGPSSFPPPALVQTSASTQKVREGGILSSSGRPERSLPGWCSFIDIHTKASMSQ